RPLSFVKTCVHSETPLGGDLKGSGAVGPQEARYPEPFTGPGARMAVIGCLVDYGIRILAAVALLLAVMASPVRPTRPPQTARSPNYLRRNFAVLMPGHSDQVAMSARPSLRESDSLQFDIEDEGEADIEDEPTVTSPLASVSFDVLPAPCPEPYSELINF